ncbi:MAG: methylated-DNA--[protein]-cysteine S-methyltransferase [Acidobacteria bacterium]|nr:methylated-DNA--[protein]-cysteine S-methyltransferase [Acidobacteriota bacterium]
MYYRFLETPLGRMLAAGDGRSLGYLEFVTSKKGRGSLAELRTRCGVSLEAADAPFDSLCRQLEAYFKGELREFDLHLAPAGTDFCRSVWLLLRDIPYGQTCSYGKVAAMMGQPRKARAIGLAAGRNPVAIVIPCHRVVGARGDLTGYASGLERKARLLDLEARFSHRLHEALGRSSSLRGGPTGENL